MNHGCTDFPGLGMFFFAGGLGFQKVLPFVGGLRLLSAAGCSGGAAGLPTLADANPRGLALADSPGSKVLPPDPEVVPVTIDDDGPEEPEPEPLPEPELHTT